MIIDGREISDILYTFVNGEKVVQYFEDSYEATKEFMRVAVSVPAILYSVETGVRSFNQSGYMKHIETGI